MRKRYILFILLILSSLFLVGCNKTADALVEYNNEFLTEDYTKTLNTFVELSFEYEELTENDQISIDEQIVFLQEKLIPQGKQLVKLVKDVKVEDEVVQELHQILIDAEESRLLAIEKENEYLHDIEQEEIIEEAIEYILESEQNMNEFMDLYETLKDEYNIEED